MADLSACRPRGDPALSIREEPLPSSDGLDVLLLLGEAAGTYAGNCTPLATASGGSPAAAARERLRWSRGRPRPRPPSGPALPDKRKHPICRSWSRTNDKSVWRNRQRHCWKAAHMPARKLRELHHLAAPLPSACAGGPPGKSAEAASDSDGGCRPREPRDRGVRFQAGAARPARRPSRQPSTGPSGASRTSATRSRHSLSPGRFAAFDSPWGPLLGRPVPGRGRRPLLRLRRGMAVPPWQRAHLRARARGGKRQGGRDRPRGELPSIAPVPVPME